MLYFILWLFGNTLFASELNYIQSEHLRNAEKSSSLLYIKNAPSTRRYIPECFSQSNSVWATPDTKKSYDDFRSKNNQAVRDRLDQSFGSPYEAFAHVGFMGNVFDYYFGLNNSGGLIAMTQDPVFPRFEVFLMQDHNVFLGKKFFILPTWYIIPQLNYGIRKIFIRNYNTSELVNDGLKIRLNQLEYEKYLTTSVTTKMEFFSFFPFLEISSIPLTDNNYNYWSSQLGVSSPDVFSYFTIPTNWDLTLSTSYSPFYGGYYDVSRTIRLELSLNYSKNFFIDFILEDEFSPGGRISGKLYFLEIALYSRLRSYDDYHFQKSRINGADLIFSW
jgi:hypothetical protein